MIELKDKGCRDTDRSITAMEEGEHLRGMTAIHAKMEYLR